MISLKFYGVCECGFYIFFLYFFGIMIGFILLPLMLIFRSLCLQLLLDILNHKFMINLSHLATRHWLRRRSWERSNPLKNVKFNDGIRKERRSLVRFVSFTSWQSIFNRNLRNQHCCRFLWCSSSSSSHGCNLFSSSFVSKRNVELSENWWSSWLQEFLGSLIKCFGPQATI